MISSVFIIMGILGILHQGIVANQWWKWGDLLGWHHEPLIAGCFIVGVVLIYKGVRK